MSARELDLFEYVATQAASMPEAVFTKPDDDWTPIMFMESADGKGAIFPLEQFMMDDKSKDILASVIMPGAIKFASAVRVVIIFSVWTAQVASAEELEPIRYVPPSQRDNREEKVLIIEYTAEGITRSASAYIERHEDAPPTLGEWEDDDMVLGANRVEGRFIEPVIKALKEVAA